MTVADDAFLVSHGLCHRLAQCDAYIFNRVVVIDVGIAHGLDVQVDQAVTGDLVQHVLEERDARLEIGCTAAVQVSPKR